MDLFQVNTLWANIQHLASPPYVVCSFHLPPSLLSWEDSVCTISVSAIAVVQAVYFCYPPQDEQRSRIIKERGLLWWAFSRITTVLLILYVLQEEQDLHPYAPAFRFLVGKCRIWASRQALWQVKITISRVSEYFHLWTKVLAAKENVTCELDLFKWLTHMSTYGDKTWYTYLCVTCFFTRISHFDMWLALLCVCEQRISTCEKKTVSN